MLQKNTGDRASKCKYPVVEINLNRKVRSRSRRPYRFQKRLYVLIRIRKESHWIVLHLKELLWLLRGRQLQKGKERKQNPDRKVFQKLRLVRMLTLPRLVEVKIVVSSQIPGIFGRESQQDLLIDEMLSLKKESLRMASRFLVRAPG